MAKRALITGMTAMQCGSTRTLLKLANVGGRWAEALRRLGYLVEHRGVRVGEDIASYDVVLVGLSKIHSIAASRVWSGLETLRVRPDVIGFVDDWQCHEILYGFRTRAKNPEGIWKLNRVDIKEAKRYWPSYRKIIRTLAKPPWPFPVLVCTHGDGGDLSLLRIPTTVVPLDPTAVRTPYPVTIVPKRERRWIQASLLKKPLDPSKYDWPVTAYGRPDRGKYGIKYGAFDGPNDQPRLPEPKLAQEYARCWGIISPAHAVSGSGWWHVRYEIARDVGAIVSGPMSEAALFGKSYTRAVNPLNVELLPDIALRQLAALQRKEFDTLAWDEDRLLTRLRTALRKRR